MNELSKRRWYLFGYWVVSLLTLNVAAGAPFVYTDTRSYLVLGSTILAKTHIAPQSMANEVASPVHPLNTKPALQSGVTPTQELDASLLIAGARSPYYSILLTILYLTGGLWLYITLQALCVMISIRYAVLRDSADVAHLLLPLFMLVSALPFFSGLVMPDTFAGVNILCCAVLVCRWAELSIRARWMLIIISLAAGLFHTSHALMAFLLGMSGLFWSVYRPLSRKPALVVIAISLLAMIALLSFPLIATRALHKQVSTPPFLTARLLADGPAKLFLEESCRKAPQRFAMCSLDYHSVNSSDAFLWHTGPFRDAGYETKKAIINQDRELAIGTVLNHPRAVFVSSLRNFSKQVTRFGVDEIADGQSLVLARPDMRSVAEMSEAETINKSDWPVRNWNFVIGVGLFVSIIGLSVILSLGRLRSNWSALIIFISIGILLNDMICAILSGPAERYSARTLWLIPVLFGGALLNLAGRRAGGKSPDGKSGMALAPSL